MVKDEEGQSEKKEEGEREMKNNNIKNIPINPRCTCSRALQKDELKNIIKRPGMKPTLYNRHTHTGTLLGAIRICPPDTPTILSVSEFRALLCRSNPPADALLLCSGRELEDWQTRMLAER